MRHYDNYDYEKEYSKQLDNLEEFEMLRKIAKEGVPYLYKTKTITSGKMVEVDVYPAFLRRREGHREKINKTSRAQRNLNDKNSRKRIRRLLNSNFTSKDYWCTFGYKEEPISMEEAENQFKRFIRRLNYKRKKKGLPNVKWICVNECGKKGRIHHHVVMDGMLSMEEVERIWKYGERNQIRYLTNTDLGLNEVGNYMAKSFLDVAIRCPGKKKWTSSIGLKQPKVTSSYTKFSKRLVRRMAENKSVFEEEIKKKYPKLRLFYTEVLYNQENGLFYLYACFQKYNYRRPRRFFTKKWYKSKQ